VFLYNAEKIPRKIPRKIAIEIAEIARITVLGNVSAIISETFLPWLTKDVLRKGYFILIEYFNSLKSSIPE
jgi:hypothetical protein